MSECITTDMILFTNNICRVLHITLNSNLLRKTLDIITSVHTTNLKVLVFFFLFVRRPRFFIPHFLYLLFWLTTVSVPFSNLLRKEQNFGKNFLFSQRSPTIFPFFIGLLIQIHKKRLKKKQHRMTLVSNTL